MSLDIIYEDDNLFVINKKCGMIVHHGAGVDSGTLEDELEALLSESKKIELKDYRYGIVHRLDKDTSGLMVIAKSAICAEFLIQQFKDHKVKKEYIAIVKGLVEKAEGEIETGIKRSEKNRKKFAPCSQDEGKYAHSYYKVLQYYDTRASKVSVNITTGRTHQIRVHMTYINHPVLGDNVYGRKSKNIPDFGLMLHAKSLSFNTPDCKELSFLTQEPERFLKMEDFLLNG